MNQPPRPDDTRHLDDEPRATADAAAGRAGVVVVDGPDLDGPVREGLARLFGRVWGRDDAVMGPIVSPEVIWASAHVGGPVAAAFVDGRLVGGTVGFVGIRGGRPRAHSHLAAVLPEFASRGIGRALKWHQRAWCLDRDITTVEWTFDPLVRRNAVINLVHLGARPVAWMPDLYGPMRDARNVGLPTDRLLVSWDLRDPRVRRAASGRTAEPDVAALRHAGAVVVLDVGDGDTPVVTPSPAPRRLARIPADIESLRRTDPGRARAWTDAMHATVGAAIDEGLRVTGITRDGWYVLAAAGGTVDLA